MCLWVCVWWLICKFRFSLWTSWWQGCNLLLYEIYRNNSSNMTFFYYIVGAFRLYSIGQLREWIGNRERERKGSDMQQMLGAGVELVTAAWTEPSVHGTPALPIAIKSIPNMTYVLTACSINQRTQQQSYHSYHRKNGKLQIKGAMTDKIIFTSPTLLFCVCLAERNPLWILRVH